MSTILSTRHLRTGVGHERRGQTHRADRNRSVTGPVGLCDWSYTMTFIDPQYKDVLTLVPLPVLRPRTVSAGAVRIITTGGGASPGNNHVIDLSLSDIERIRDVLTARLESASAGAQTLP